MDESVGTSNSRFARLGIGQTAESRRAYRELLGATPDPGNYIGGAILSDETIRRRTSGGTLFVGVLRDAGIVPGINVDTVARDLAALPGEKGASTGSAPEVLMTGHHTMETCRKITEQLLHTVFEQAFSRRVIPEAMLLKPDMILPGLDCPVQEDAPAVAHAAVTSLFRSVPAAVSGVVFLSGGPDPATRQRAPECNDPGVRIASAVGAFVCVWAGAAATRAGGVERRCGERQGGAGGSAASGALQWGRAPRWIARVDLTGL